MSSRVRHPAATVVKERHCDPWRPVSDGLVTKARMKRLAICGQINEGTA